MSVMAIHHDLRATLSDYGIDLVNVTCLRAFRPEAAVPGRLIHVVHGNEGTTYGLLPTSMKALS